MEAKPSSFNSCLVLSINKHSISELLSVNRLKSSKSLSAFLFFKSPLKVGTEYGGLDTTIENFSNSESSIFCNLPTKLLESLKLSKPSPCMIWARPSP